MLAQRPSRRKRLAPASYQAPEIGSIALTEIVGDSGADCTGSSREGEPAIPSGKARGFKLALEGVDGKSSKTLHEDRVTPASRDCPTSYSLSEAYLFESPHRPPVVAVLVQRLSLGGKAGDRRNNRGDGQPSAERVTSMASHTKS